MTLVYSPTLWFVLLGLSVAAFVFVRVRNNSLQYGFEEVEPESDGAIAVKDGGQIAKLFERRKTDRRGTLGRRGQDLSNGLERAAQATAAQTTSAPRGPVSKALPPGASALYGAYRVEQEVGKLVLGQPHRMDVLSSRAPDDRRAIEVSLLKYINLEDADEDGIRRARTALEEYGFVARQCAALLLAHSAYERSSAARTLGEIGSATAVPFILEALYDTDEIVRVQAVTCLGMLKLPSAIGALLDMARRYPDMPSDLISRVLSACSVDCFDIGMPMGGELLALGEGADFSGEITDLEPAGFYDSLPAASLDSRFVEILARAQDPNAPDRADAIRSLGDFRVQPAVEALSRICSDENDPALRAAAITALGAIDHPTVFIPVVIALAEDSREVRAAAARALSGLNIDRADAYALVVQTGDEYTRRRVAMACIKSGIAKQALERLSSSDHRQAYEAFATLAVLASANEIGTILEAISGEDEYTAIAACRVLGAAGQPDSLPRLRQMAVRDAISETLRTAVLEVIYKMDQNLPV